MELKMCVVHYWCWIRLICITETVLHYICGDTGTRVWMSDVDTAHQPVNVFKIAEDGFKVVQEKEMEEADKPQNAKMTDGLGKCSVFSLYWFLVLLRKPFVQCATTKWIILWKLCCSFQVCCRKRTIVFSTILISDHLGATFVFNAGDVEAAVDNKSSVSSITYFMMSCELIFKKILGRGQRSEVRICGPANG